MPKLNGADYLLLLLFLNNKEPILGAVRLIKMMFLFNTEITPLLKNSGLDSENLPSFFSYNYGPFSKDIYEQIELFKGIKFISVTNIKTTEGLMEVDDWEEKSFVDGMKDSGYELNVDGAYYKYTLLKLGESYVKDEILPHINPSQMELMEKFKTKITTISPKQLLKYVYSKYPEYTDKSLIKDEVFGNE